MCSCVVVCVLCGCCCCYYVRVFVCVCHLFITFVYTGLSILYETDENRTEKTRKLPTTEEHREESGAPGTHAERRPKKDTTTYNTIKETKCNGNTTTRTLLEKKWNGVACGTPSATATNNNRTPTRKNAETRHRERERERVNDRQTRPQTRNKGIFTYTSEYRCQMKLNGNLSTLSNERF